MTATRHDMAFKRLASMIKEWITDDAYCIMSLLNHNVPYGWMHHLEFGADQIQGGAFSQMPKSLWPGCPWSAIPASAQNTPILCQQNDMYICMASYCEMKCTKNVRGYSLKSSSHMIKRHFDVRLVFRPNKCTESQHVFSSEVQPGPIIEGCLILDEAQEREEESSRWNGVPDELSRSGVLEETQHVYNAALILRSMSHSVAPAHHPVSSWARRSADGLMKRRSMHMWVIQFSLMDNDWKNSGHGTLSEQESRARQLFFLMFFSWCTVQFPFLYLRHWIQLFMLIILVSCCSHCSHV